MVYVLPIMTVHREVVWVRLSTNYLPETILNVDHEQYQYRDSRALNTNTYEAVEFMKHR